MNVCIVSLNFPWYFRVDEPVNFGGAEVQAAFVARALASQGHEVSFVVANLRPDDKIPNAAENAFQSAEGIPGLRFVYPRVPGILHALERANADVYYQRNAAMVTGVTALFCRKKGRVFVYGAGSDTDFSFRDARMDSFRDRVLFYTGLKLARGVVVQNEFQREKYLARHHKPVRVIPNGIDVAESGAAGPRDIVAWIGDFRRIKQPELFLELARRIPDREFVLIGGRGGAEPSFERKVRESAARIPNLKLTGQIPHVAIRDHLARAVVLVNTSKVEGFPNAYLEAWNLGVPVVSFNDVDGLVAKENLGAICEGMDGMEQAVRSFSSDAERSVSAGLRARTVVRERFSAPALARHYIEFFQELSGGVRSG